MPTLTVSGRPGDSPLVVTVGRWYPVPCVLVDVPKEIGPRATFWLPIYGPLHRDTDIIHFDWEHYHVDVRFMGVQRLADWDEGRYAWIQHLEQRAMLLPVIVGNQPSRGRWKVARESQPAIHQRKCYRQWPDFPTGGPRFHNPWERELAETYSRCRINLENPVCPHRRFPLTGVPADADGIVTCPGHGLRWDITSGRAAGWQA